jgi:hypothetical protein
MEDVEEVAGSGADGLEEAGGGQTYFFVGVALAQFGNPEAVVRLAVENGQQVHPSEGPATHVLYEDPFVRSKKKEFQKQKHIQQKRLRNALGCDDTELQFSVVPLVVND